MYQIFCPKCGNNSFIGIQTDKQLECKCSKCKKWKFIHPHPQNYYVALQKTIAKITKLVTNYNEDDDCEKFFQDINVVINKFEKSDFEEQKIPK